MIARTKITNIMVKRIHTQSLIVSEEIRWTTNQQN
jgi:hypothetical protein